MPSPSFVQANSFAPVAPVPVSLSVSTLANTTAGNYLVVFVFGSNTGGTLTDSQGNTYSFEVIGNGIVTEYHVNGCIGGPLTVTLTLFGPSPGNIGISVLEYANIAENINDQIGSVNPFGMSIGEFGLCPPGPQPPGGANYYLLTGFGTNLVATYAWQNWSPSTGFGDNSSNEAQYIVNNLTPQNLEGVTSVGTSGLSQPAWNVGGATNDNTVIWNDSLIQMPGDSIVALGIYADAGGVITLNGIGWILRTSASGLSNVFVYDRLPEPFVSTFNISIDKLADTFDLGAQLSHVTAFTGSSPVPPILYNPNINTKTLPYFQLPFCVTDKRKTDICPQYQSL